MGIVKPISLPSLVSSKGRAPKGYLPVAKIASLSLGQSSLFWRTYSYGRPVSCKNQRTIWPRPLAEQVWLEFEEETTDRLLLTAQSKVAKLQTGEFSHSVCRRGKRKIMPEQSLHGGLCIYILFMYAFCFWKLARSAWITNTIGPVLLSSPPFATYYEYGAGFQSDMMLHEINESWTL